MQAASATLAPVGSSNFGLFDTVPEDILHFGHGQQFKAKAVSDFLSLTRTEVSHLASVSESSVRYDKQIPAAVRERLEEIAMTINLVAKQFNGDANKTVAWFKARNPFLGDISPRDMIRLGRFERLRRFIIGALTATS